MPKIVGLIPYGVGLSESNRGPEEPCWLDEQCAPGLACHMIDAFGGRCRSVSPTTEQGDTAPATFASSPAAWAKENPYVVAAAVGAGVFLLVVLAT